MTHYSKILATGHYLPEKVLTNADLEKMVDTSDEWIMQRVGVKQRHIIGDSSDTTTSMAIEAAKEAIKNSKIKADAIDLIIVATTTPYYLCPNTATQVQYAIGLSEKEIPAFDISAACTGFIYGLSIADQYIRAGTCRTILLIGVDSLTKITDWNDRSTAILFGDGAGAIILQADDQPGMLKVKIHADGQYEQLLKTRSGVFGQHPPEAIQMEGKEVYKKAVTKLGEIAKQTLKESGLAPEELDWLIPHQANLRIIESTARKLRLSMDKVILTVERHGNTSAASVPLALHEGVEQGLIHRGQNLLLEAFGAGFSWGGAVIRF